MDVFPTQSHRQINNKCCIPYYYSHSARVAAEQPTAIWCLVGAPLPQPLLRTQRTTVRSIEGGRMERWYSSNRNCQPTSDRSVTSLASVGSDRLKYSVIRVCGGRGGASCGVVRRRAVWLRTIRMEIGAASNISRKYNTQ